MRVAAVIPAFNEERSISGVLRVLVGVPAIDEIVVVNDGSRDQTSAVARQFRVRVIELPENRGKGAAMKAGLDATTAPVILFLDADLIGLTVPHVQALLEPVVRGSSDMTIGLFEGGRARTDWAQVIAPYLSGQRAVRREVLESLTDWNQARFGVEVALTRYTRKQDLRVSEVILPEMSHRMKEEKMGLVRGLWARARMYWDIVRALPPRL